jgi:hypothetical protein
MNPLIPRTVLGPGLLLHSAAVVTDRAALTASWVGSRWGIDPVLLDVRRRGGEVLAFREPGSDEWRYPGWQFEDDGNVKPAVARVLAAAREAGVRPERVAEILNRRAGLSGGRTLLDSLLEGDERQVLAELRR